MNNQDITGIGNDIIEIERIKKSIAHHGESFITRIFTTEEIIYCKKHKNPYPHYAGRFAAKEAVAKALGTGITAKIGWRDIAITNDKKGTPVVTLSLPLQETYNEITIHLSISHCKQYAIATAIITNS
jgi:holo-[acyl-carrier protein] synthase